MSAQPKLFDLVPVLPEGFRYQPELISGVQERALVDRIRELPFEAFRFHGFGGNRRVVSYGWPHDFEGTGLEQAEEIPGFLLPLRDAAAEFADLPAEQLVHVLVTEYGPGAAIGWHK